MRAGEPVLFFVAFALTVPLAAGIDWYADRKFTRMLDRAAGCYGRLTALSALQPVGAKSSGFADYELIRANKAVALDAAAHLGRNAAAVGRDLDQQAALAKTRTAALEGHGGQAAQFVEARRLCTSADDTSRF